MSASPATRNASGRRPISLRFARALGFALALGVAAWFGFSLYVEEACIYAAPALPADHPALRTERIDVRPGFARFGAAWRRDDRGLQELYLPGDAVWRGRAVAELCLPALAAQERTMADQVQALVPPGLRRHLLRKGVLFRYRDLPEYVDDRFEVELAAMMLSFAEPHPLDAEIPTFHRLLFYQALYDAGQSMAESGLVEADVGCTTLVASGAAARRGGLVLARNCDFEAGAVFDDRKAVLFVEPDDGQRYVHVAWAGMLGVLSGVNERGLVVMLHAARTERSRWPSSGTPVPLVLRDAMVHDATIEDVAERFRNAGHSAAAIVVVAECGSGRAALVETDADRTVVVPMEGGRLAATNHLRDPSWDGDEVVERMRSAGSSALRLARAEELLAEAHGSVDARFAGEALRDDLGLGGRDVGLGNRTTISARIVAHAVVVDAGRRRLHVSLPPRGLGAYAAYDLDAFFGARGVPDPDRLRIAGPPEIPAHEDPASAGRAAQGRELLAHSAAALREDRPAEALDAAELAVERMERAPPALLALAESLAALGRDDEARAVAVEALGRQPVPGAEQDALRRLAAR